MPNSLVKSPRLLIVDDDPESLSLMLDWLSARQAKIYQVRNGEQALKVLQKKSVDAVISDWHLPGLSGLELVKSLRASGFSGPLLLCTGVMLGAEHLQEAFDAGANEYLRKPMNVVEFNARLDKSLLYYAQTYALSRFCDSQQHLVDLMSEQLGGDLQGLLQMMELERFDQEAMQRFQPNRYQLTQQLKERFQQLMNWSRYRFAMLRAEPGPVEVRLMLKSLQQQFGDQAERLQISAPSGLEAFSNLDLLMRILTQLVDNALRYTSGPVLVKALAYERGVRFCVLDEGDLSEGEMDRLLAGQGVHLGLRICHDLLALLGTRLEGSPRRQTQGNQFYFDLPAL